MRLHVIIFMDALHAILSCLLSVRVKLVKQTAQLTQETSRYVHWATGKWSVGIRHLPTTRPQYLLSGQKDRVATELKVKPLQTVPIAPCLDIPSLVSSSEIGAPMAVQQVISVPLAVSDMYDTSWLGHVYS